MPTIEKSGFYSTRHSHEKVAQMNTRILGFFGLFGLFGALGFIGEPALFSLFGLFGLFALFAMPRPKADVSNQSQPLWAVMIACIASSLVAGTVIVTFLIT